MHHHPLNSIKPVDIVHTLFPIELLVLGLLFTLVSTSKTHNNYFYIYFIYMFVPNQHKFINTPIQFNSIQSKT